MLKIFDFLHRRSFPHRLDKMHGLCLQFRSAPQAILSGRMDESPNLSGNFGA